MNSMETTFKIDTLERDINIMESSLKGLVYRMRGEIMEEISHLQTEEAEVIYRRRFLTDMARNNPDNEELLHYARKELMEIELTKE